MKSKLTILSTFKERRYGRMFTMAICKCECGRIKTCYLTQVKRNNIKSCGCLQAYRWINPHGESKNPIYQLWSNMITRCEYEGAVNYHRYGGRGITVCAEWRNDYFIFKTWALNNGYKRGLQLDRINNDGNYTPINCRFVTPKENSNNKSKTKNNEKSTFSD